MLKDAVFKQIKRRHHVISARTANIIMFRVIILYLWTYSIQREALLIADAKLVEDEESRDSQHRNHIILTEYWPKQYIESSGFPNDWYSPSSVTEYDVEVLLSNEVRQMGARIHLYFEVFKLEPSPNCRNDGFEVLDNTTGQLRVYCGTETGRNLVSESDSLSLRFFSDYRFERQGFRIQIAILASTCSHEFDGRYTGRFNSPNYPKNYIKDDTCIWKIVAPEGRYVQLTFDNDFDVMSPDEMCSQDSVLVSASGDMKTEFKRYCGKTTPGIIESTTNTMIVKFRSDCCFEGKGFSATFNIIEKDPPPTPPLAIISQECECGTSFGFEDHRMTGGEEIRSRHLYPWVAGLINLKNLLYCGATLISDQYLLTAAHCVKMLHSSAIIVVLDAQERNITSESILLLVEDIIVHEKFNKRTYFNDIALIRLSKKVELTREFYPLCLPTKDYQTYNTKGVVVGWGRTTYGTCGKFFMESQTLKHVAIPVVPTARCIEIYGNQVLDTSICVGETGKDPCGSDSGGPFFTQISNNRWMMVGILSWGINCGKDENPGVFVQVSKYLDWIYERTGELCPATTEGSTVPSTLHQIPTPPPPNIRDCGIANSVKVPKNVGGRKIGPVKFPWIALISFNGHIRSVGSLVNRRYVLTAYSRFPNWLIRNPEYIDVYLGENHLNQTEPYTKAHKVVRVIAYPRNEAHGLYDFNFALVELFLDEDLPQKFRPICIPPENMEIPDGVELIVAGWGSVSTNGKESSMLMETDWKLINWDNCSKLYQMLTRSMVCAENTDKNTCYGDSGAPLMILSRGRYFLVGIISMWSKEGCGISGKPSIFSATQSIHTWLTSYVNLT